MIARTTSGCTCRTTPRYTGPKRECTRTRVVSVTRAEAFQQSSRTSVARLAVTTTYSASFEVARDHRTRFVAESKGLCQLNGAEDDVPDYGGVELSDRTLVVALAQ